MSVLSDKITEVDKKVDDLAVRVKAIQDALAQAQVNQFTQADIDALTAVGAKVDGIAQ